MIPSTGCWPSSCSRCARAFSVLRRRAGDRRTALPPGVRFEQAGGVTMHADQVEVTTDVVRRLVDDQFPAWRHLPVRRVASTGTVNAIFRIGDGLAARFPLRAQDSAEAR